MLNSRPGPRDATGGWCRLWTAVRPAEAPHAVAPWALGEYAALLRRRGAAAAADRFPTIALHVLHQCHPCRTELETLLALLEDT